MINKFGYNPAVGTTQEDVWVGGGTYPWPTTALAVRVASGGDANDTAAGTGARTVTVVGLDANFEPREETINLAGASQSSDTTQTFIRIVRAFVASAGTYTGSNVGTVTIEQTDGTTVAVINPTLGQTQLALYTIPSGYIGYLVKSDISVEDNKRVDVVMYTRDNADQVTAPFTARRLKFQVFCNHQRSATTRHLYQAINEKTDIWWAATNTQTGNAGVAVDFDIILVKL